ncbi:MAG TPA: polyphosphate polymerase domain-containing protein [Acetivibrio sp.]|uniref:polyphosphate polymerase domain-containing protein n=1 Tax=Acetivibrio sp. TaxID=1872092 RepID=UPI002C53E8BB|nr:polyphosphate polymerase domain-containing protein [Acetivibrio sp.]HOM03627.1 polyphosphate polymerase domain-containing protein [Acetivibrio sp.]
MAIEVFNRYEKKYLMDNETYMKVKNILLEYMELDEYNKVNNTYYTISNIYYDTQDNQLIRHSVSKPRYKEKLRLRAYGVPSLDTKVYLEIKKKVNGLVNKRRTKLTLKEAYEFAATGTKPGYQSYMNKQVLNEIEYLLNMYDLEPKLYLAYDRMAYFGINNRDLRITFDTNIRSRRTDLRLELGDYGEQLLDEGVWLMEVKAEKSIPVWLSRMLSENKLFKTSFSKYGTEYKKMILSNITKEDESGCLTEYLMSRLA